MGTLRIIPRSIESPFREMALDHALFEIAIQQNSATPILRFYQFESESITVGFSQRNPSLVERVSALQLPWVRRLTGGGMVRHQNDIIFSAIFPAGIHKDFATSRSTYQAIHLCIAQAFTEFQIKTMFQSGCQKQDFIPEHMICFEKPICDDLIYQNQKIVGGAQRRTRGFVLHQGSIQLNRFSQNYDNQITISHLEKAVIRAFQEYFYWESELRTLTSQEISLSRALEMDQYRNPVWNRRGRQDSKEIRMSAAVC